MKPFLTIGLLAAAILTSSADAVTAVRANSAVRLDGRLNDKAWANAPEYTAFFNNKGGAPAAAQTAVKVLYDDNAVYFGIRCADSDVKNLKTASRPRDGGIYALDNIEIMLDPATTKERYYHFMVSATGDVYDAFREQGGGVSYQSWNGIWAAKTFVGKEFWSCEIKIPFYNFSEPSSLSGNWLVNVCRGKRTNPAGDSSIAKGAYHAMAAWVPLTGLAVNFEPYRVELKAPEVKIKVADKGVLAAENSTVVANCTAQASQYAADTWLVEKSSGAVLTGPITKFELKPGERRNLTLPAITVKNQGEYQNVLRLSDATGRTIAYRDATTDIRFSPVTIKLDTPWYRYCIFETQKIKDVIFDVAINMPSSALAGKALAISVKENGKSVYEYVEKNAKPQQRFTIANAALPYGRFTLHAELRDAAGKPVEFGGATVPLWKLPYKKSETWLDRDGSIKVEGKPFFMHTAHTSWEFIQPCYTVFYSFFPDGIGPDQRWMASQLGFLKEMKQPAMLRAMQTDFVDAKYVDIFRQYVRRDRDHEKLFAYYLMDEPSARSISVAALKQIYEAIRAEDPYHPVAISDSPRNEYIEACDIQVHHPYPNVVDTLKNNDCRTIYTVMASAQRMLENGYHKVAFVFMDMGFNKYDYGLGPREGRMASFEEFRDHTLMAFAVGMKGLMPFNVSFEIYPEGTIGFPAIDKLAAYLGPFMNAADAGKAMSPDNPDLKMAWKTDGKDQVLVASNVSMRPGQYTIQLTGLPATFQTLNVVGENRTVQLQNGRFRDTFAPCGGHAYTTGTVPATVPDVAQTEREIAAAWQAKHKPGNLLFTPFLIRAKLKLSASIQQSTRYTSATPDATLWHLTDGYFPVKPGGYGFWYWQVNSDKLPAWVRCELDHPQTVGRIVVYPMLRSVRAMSLEVYTGGAWKTVGTVENFTGERHEFTFAPEKISQFRLNLQAANGKAAYIGEIEAYAK